MGILSDKNSDTRAVEMCEHSAYAYIDAFRKKKRSKTWFTEDSEENTTDEGEDDPKEDDTRDRKENPPFQNCTLRDR